MVVPPPSPPPRRLLRWLNWLPLIVLMTGLGVTTLLTLQAWTLGQAERDRLEKAAVREAGQALQIKLEAARQTLYSIAGLFHASREVTRREFRVFYDSLRLSADSLQGIQGIGFTELVALERRPDYEQRIRAEGFPDFRLYPVPVSRPYYTAITFLEPFDWRNRRAFGYDMASEPVRRAAMEQARDMGTPTLSGPVTLRQETDTDVQVGALLYLPVYNQQVPLLTVADRRRALIGWAYSTLRVGDLVQSALANPVIRLPVRMDIQLFDRDAQSRNLLYDSRPTEQRTPALIAGPEQVVPLAGRNWVVRARLVDAPDFESGTLASTLAILGAGVGTSLLLAWATRFLVRQHRSTVAMLEALQAAQTDQQLAGAVFTSSPLGIVITDAEARILQVNPAFTRITGYSEPEALGQNPRILQSGLHDPEFFRQMWQTLGRYGGWEGEIWNRNRRGETYCQGLSITAVRDVRQQVTHYIGLLRDVTRDRQERDRVSYQAQHDYLTDLPNRSLLLERLAQALVQAQRYGHFAALLFLDLDRFKPINDQHGHAAGDWVLRQVADRLRQSVRASDTVCRQGGDEFVLLIPELKQADGALLVAHKLQACVDAPYIWNGLRLEVTASIGIAIYPDHGTSADELLAAADQAMYEAKHSAGERIALAARRSTLAERTVEDTHSEKGHIPEDAPPASDDSALET